jgi:DNA-binding NtrC family response regulator
MSDERTIERRSVRVPVRTVRASVERGASLVGERITIGSASDCDLVVADRTVSRYHAEIEAAPDGIRVRDLGSTNGTWVARAKIVEAIVGPGTRLSLGDASVRVDDAELAHEAVYASEELGEWIARSASTRRLLERLERACGADAPVLITGAPGTGKELVARTLHARSPRSSGPLVFVDAGALTGPLAQSDLFGHERGAFTDADETRIGAFERAHGGTLVLDEIAELPAEAQPLLLGALERRSARRVGGRAEIPFDVRVVAISSRDLRREVNEGRFRHDLYFRLAVIRLEVPSLRERLDDVGPLIGRFLEERGHGPTHALAQEERVAELAARDWPGNVRELRNVVESALAWDEPPTPDEPRVEVESTEALIETLLALPYKEARARFESALERAYLRELTRRARGNTSLAARLAGLDRSQLRVLLARNKID